MTNKGVLVEQIYDQTERLQADHYNRIAKDYAEHYGDKYSQQYRNQFINDPMFEGIELEGSNVLEAMCGSGETTGYLLGRGAKVTGLDVSETEIEKFKKRWPDADGVCSSIFETTFNEDWLDMVVVVGGLHHLHPHLSQAVAEMHRIIKPGAFSVLPSRTKGLRSIPFANSGISTTNFLRLMKKLLTSKL